MDSQLLSDGGDPHRASGARFFKMAVALSAGLGFFVGAIVAVSLFATFDTHTVESSSLVALPISHHANGMGIKQFQQSNAYRVRAEGEDRYAKPPNDSFYGVGAKQVRQSNAYAGRFALPTALPSLPEREDRYAKGLDDAFTGMGMGLEKPSVPFPIEGRDAAVTNARFPPLPTALPSWPGREDRYAKGPDDAFTGMGMGLEKPSAPFPVEGRDAANAGFPPLPTAFPSWEREDRYAKGPNDAFTGMGMGLEKPNVPFPLEGRDGMGNQQFQHSETYAGLPPVPTALPRKPYASLSAAYGMRSKESQENTIEFESLRV